MDDTSSVFGFERDFAGSLHCIPMAVRFKLDLCGIKLSLRQWNRLLPEDRRRLLEAGCGSPAETHDYRQRLLQLIGLRTGLPAEELAVEPHPAWEDVVRIPDQVREYARARALPEPSVAQWAALSSLQRFTLVKLSRPKHDNVNFGPAMVEFGLAPAG